jgi:alpha-1,2-mannosyltransferase
VLRTHRYYRVFALLYTWALSLSSVKVTNSSWTKAHIDILLGRARHPISRVSAPEVSILYPPCDTGSLGELEIGAEEKRQRVVLSLAQFRSVQLRIS